MNLDPCEPTDDLIEEAFDCIDVGDFEAALKLGRRLRRESPPWGFEILALAYAGLGDRARAIEALRQGVAETPNAWRLWQLLGNYQSDEGRFDECHEAYRRALACADVDASSVHLNYAIALLRQAQHTEALRHLNRVTDPEMRLQAIDMRLELFNRLEWYTQAIELGRNAVDTYPAYEVIETDAEALQSLAKVHAELGLALWLGRQDREGALAQAWEAIALDKGQHTGMWIVRELTGEVSPRGKYYQVTIRGTWHEPMEHDGEWSMPDFKGTYEVVADAPEEAIEFIRPFEPEGMRDSLQIDECTELEPCTDQPKGVYAVPEEYRFFPGE